MEISCLCSRREPGDWSCSQCNEVNFKSRTTCRRCSTARNQPQQTNAAATTLPQNTPRAADWNCHHCNVMNFASRDACFKCRRAKPESPGSNNPPSAIPRPADWICQSCANNNFAARIACHKCGRPKVVPTEVNRPPQAVSMEVNRPPQVVVKPGDWKCSSCPETNFGSRVVCRSCGAARPSTDNKSSGNQGDCVICMDKQIDSVITTCGHSAVCLQCGNSITLCPICRNPFNQQQLIKLYNVY